LERRRRGRFDGRGRLAGSTGSAGAGPPHLMLCSLGTDRGGPGIPRHGYLLNDRSMGLARR
jgi:hypothetical protein